MPTIQSPEIPNGLTTEQLANIVAMAFEELFYLANGNIDSKNTREIGGYLVSLDSLASKNGVVGLSSAITAGDDIRIWAGNATKESAPFRVYESGHIYASDVDITGKITATSGIIGGWTIGATSLSGSGILEGGTVRSGASNADRVEMSGGKFGGYTASSEKTGLYFDISAVGGGTGITDISLYHNNSELMVFYDNITNFIIKPGLGTSSMVLGTTGSTVYANGSWDFSSGASGTVYVSSTSGGPTDTAITFTTGLRTV